MCAGVEERERAGGGELMNAVAAGCEAERLRHVARRSDHAASKQAPMRRFRALPFASLTCSLAEFHVCYHFSLLMCHSRRHPRRSVCLSLLFHRERYGAAMTPEVPNGPAIAIVVWSLDLIAHATATSFRHSHPPPFRDSARSNKSRRLCEAAAHLNIWHCLC